MRTFDIILPTVGRDSLLYAVESVIAQTHKNWFLWVIKDINTHPVDCILDDRIYFCTAFDGPHNDYGAWSRNCGISSGAAKWIAYIDDDDEWLPHHLSTLDRLINDNPGIDMVRTAGQSFMMKHKSPRSSKLVRKMGPVNSTDILTVGMAHTRGMFEKTSGWQPHDNHDHTLWREMLAAGGKAVESDEVTFHFSR